jgi:hypothetical protein
MSDWTLEDRFLTLNTHWVALIGEHYTDHRGQRLEYYRAERPSSVIVLPVLDNTLLLPPRSFRPGIGESALDFPGGRIGDESVEKAATRILHRELNLSEDMLQGLELMNRRGWPVDSSFSDQRLFGAVARLHPNASPGVSGERFPLTPEGQAMLLRDLECVQCRLVLLHFLRATGGAENASL